MKFQIKIFRGFVTLLLGISLIVTVAFSYAQQVQAASLSTPLIANTTSDREVNLYPQKDSTGLSEDLQIRGRAQERLDRAANDNRANNLDTARDIDRTSKDLGGKISNTLEQAKNAFQSATEEVTQQR